MMSREDGSPERRVWLLGDSEPANWRERLAVPLDSRHPARHSIWTPVLDVVQRRLYEIEKLRFDDRAMYIRNAISLVAHKPAPSARAWSGQVQTELEEFTRLTRKHRPLLIISFGAFACEFALRSLPTSAPPRETIPFGDWSTKALGARFLEVCSSFDLSTTNHVSLLHATIARGRFLESHRDFCGADGANYFEFVGAKIADLLACGRNDGVRFL
jgi:hypothetical protein